MQGSDAPGNRGWEATAVERNGQVAAIWLDHRELAEASSSTMPMHHEGQDHSAHAAPSDGSARAQLSKLLFGFVGGSEPPRADRRRVLLLQDGARGGADGSLYAAWRHVYPGNVRDIAFTLSRDEGRPFSAPTRVSDDKWVLDGCPENGPAMAIGPRERIHLVWPTLVNGSTPGSEPALALFYSTSDDGRNFAARQQLATQGTPGHPQIALSATDGSLLVVWDEVKDGTRRAVAARGVPDSAGRLQFADKQLAPVGSAYPVVASTNSGFVRGWTDTSRAAFRDRPSTDAGIGRVFTYLTDIIDGQGYPPSRCPSAFVTRRVGQRSLRGARSSSSRGLHVGTCDGRPSVSNATNTMTQYPVRRRSVLFGSPE